MPARSKNRQTPKILRYDATVEIKSFLTMPVWPLCPASNHSSARYDANVASGRKSTAYDGSAAKTLTGRTIRPQRGYSAKNHDHSPAQCTEAIRSQFWKKYDQK